VEQFKKADNNEINNYKSFLKDFLSDNDLENKNIYLKKILDTDSNLYDHIADTI
jgi:hypothetical protein